MMIVIKSTHARAPLRAHTCTRGSTVQPVPYPLIRLCMFWPSMKDASPARSPRIVCLCYLRQPPGEPKSLMLYTIFYRMFYAIHHTIRYTLLDTELYNILYAILYTARSADFFLYWILFDSIRFYWILCDYILFYPRKARIELFDSTRFYEIL